MIFSDGLILSYFLLLCKQMFFGYDFYFLLFLISSQSLLRLFDALAFFGQIHIDKFILDFCVAADYDTGNKIHYIKLACFAAARLTIIRPAAVYRMCRSNITAPSTVTAKLLFFILNISLMKID